MDELFWSRFVKSICSIIYTNFGLVMIMFVLFISIYSKSLLSFGYFIFCMLLIYNFRKFMEDP